MSVVAVMTLAAGMFGLGALIVYGPLFSFVGAQ
jgi:hypothetical protein